MQKGNLAFQGIVVMIDSQLLELIVCPENKERLSLAPDVTLAKINALIARSTLRFVGGEPVTENIDQLLIRTDGRVGYAVFQGIPNLLIEEGIPLSKLDT